MPIIIPDPEASTGPLDRANQRIAQNRSATLTQTFYVDGTATDPSPDAATIQIVRSDGTELVAETAATEAGTGVVTYTLTPAQTSILDTLTVTWTATIGGQEQIYVETIEVVGGFLFTLAEARAVDGLNRKNNLGVYTYTNDQIIETRTLVEQTLEEACGRAFVPRYTRETVDGTGSYDLLLSNPDLRLIRSVAVDSTGYEQEDLDLLAMRPSGILHGTSAWTSGSGNVTVGYEHGMAFPPMRVKRAALILARSWLVTGPIDDRTATFNITDGGTYSLVVPGRNGSHVGIPEVDTTIDEYAMRIGVG